MLKVALVGFSDERALYIYRIAEAVQEIIVVVKEEEADLLLVNWSPDIVLKLEEGQLWAAVIRANGQDLEELMHAARDAGASQVDEWPVTGRALHRQLLELVVHFA